MMMMTTTIVFFRTTVGHNLLTSITPLRSVRGCGWGSAAELVVKRDRMVILLSFFTTLPTFCTISSTSRRSYVRPACLHLLRFFLIFILPE